MPAALSPESTPQAVASSPENVAPGSSDAGALKAEMTGTEVGDEVTQSAPDQPGSAPDASEAQVVELVVSDKDVVMASDTAGSSSGGSAKEGQVPATSTSTAKQTRKSSRKKNKKAEATDTTITAELDVDKDKGSESATLTSAPAETPTPIQTRASRRRVKKASPSSIAQEKPAQQVEGNGNSKQKAPGPTRSKQGASFLTKLVRKLVPCVYTSRGHVDPAEVDDAAGTCKIKFKECRLAEPKRSRK
jgi:hypothetical protein